MGTLHGFTVDEYYRMADAGILTEDDRVELIRGRIIDMAAIGSPHINMTIRLTQLLVPAIGSRGVVSVQNPVRLDDLSEPRPDVAVLRPEATGFEAPTPRAADALLLIEVADSSLAYDREEKAPLYAVSGIPEYWIANLPDRVFEVHRQPEGERYRELRRVGPGEELDVAMLPGVRLAASLLLGP